MDNYAIADQLSLLSKLMDIHGENAFKAKSYASAAFALEKLPQEVASLPKEKIATIRGIGESVGSKIWELVQTGELQALQQLIAATPEGVLQMMNIKGLGPKKIFTLWKENNIDNIDALKEACQQNTIAALKGFGEKTQQSILAAINFQESNAGRYLYAQIEPFAEALHEKLESAFKEESFTLTGAYRRQMDVIESLEWITTTSIGDLKKFFDDDAYEILKEEDSVLLIRANKMISLQFYSCTQNDFAQQLFITTGSDVFIEACKSLPNWQSINECKSEAAIFDVLQLPFIPPYQRETANIITIAQQGPLPQVVQGSDIKGLIHSHSQWSDGGYTIEAMATELVKQGFEYMVISDHSKAAFYANGLSEERIKAQHKEIDALNKKLAPFKIYKSIECDILNDGTMDYSNDVLSTFDLVIASIHSNLQMTEEKAMQRLLGAISNPYVTVLGHMTGRLLIKRKGYPVNHTAVIEACAQNNVVIEINASPQRLDMDWHFIDEAIRKKVMLSINPDAHTLDDFRYIKYGVLTAQKGGLTNAHNLSSLNRQQFEAYITNRKKEKGLIP